MFQPSLTCQLLRRTGRDIHGQERLADPVTIAYSPVSMVRQIEQTSVRTDSSASRGQAEQTTSKTKILVLPNVSLGTDDRLVIDGLTYRVSMVHPRRTVFGVLDHQELDLEVLP
jgi:hypothetical protein